jgi:hypothetical protein
MALEKTIFEELQGGIGIDLSYWRISMFTISRDESKVAVAVDGYFDAASRAGGKPLATKNVMFDLADLEAVNEANIYVRLTQPINVSRGSVNVIGMDKSGKAVLTGDTRELTEDINPFTGAVKV